MRGIKYYLLVLVLVLPLIWPLLQPGFFVSDDGEWMVIRLSAFHETLRTGQFPVRFLERLNHSYGYPVTNFLYPLPFYLGEAIHLLGFGFTDSVKILFAGSFLLSAVFMYKFIAGEWGSLAGVAAAVFYAYFPYRVFDVYKRGSLGEAVAFIFIPLVFYYLSRIFKYGRWRDTALGALSLAVLITSHNVIAFLFLPVAGIFSALKIWYSNNKKQLIALTANCYLLTAMSSAWFWLPALYDLQYTRAGSIQVADFSRYFLTADNFWKLIGPLLPAAIVVLMVQIIRTKKYEITFALGVTVLSVLLALPVSSIVWDSSLLPRLVQFPWRFLAVTAFFGAVLVGYLLKNKMFLVAVLAMCPIVLGLSQVKTERIFRPESYYLNNDDTTTVQAEYMPKWVKDLPAAKPTRRIEYISNTIAQINTVYFPGHKVFIDGKETRINYEDNGLIKIAARRGQDIQTRFTKTPLRTTADILALLGITIIAGLLVFDRIRATDV